MTAGMGWSYNDSNSLQPKLSISITDEAPRWALQAFGHNRSHKYIASYPVRPLTNLKDATQRLRLLEIRLLTFGIELISPMPNPKCLDPSLNQQRIPDSSTTYWTTASIWTACSEWEMRCPQLDPWPHMSYAWNWMNHTLAEAAPTQPILPFLTSLSLSKRARTRKNYREKMEIGDEGGRWSEDMQPKIIISSSSTHPHLMSSHLI